MANAHTVDISSPEEVSVIFVPINCKELIDIEEVIKCYAKEYNLDPDLAVRVAQCESGLDPLAKNPYSSARGLFQHLRFYWTTRIVRFNLPKDFDIYDIYDNTVMAMELASVDGWYVHWEKTVFCWQK